MKIQRIIGIHILLPDHHALKLEINNPPNKNPHYLEIKKKPLK
jgi:hypothetical protein